MKLAYGILFLAIAVLSCNKPENPPGEASAAEGKTSNILPPLLPGTKYEYLDISTGSTTPPQLMAFARSLEGTPYKYGSTDPDEGFDCSGYVTYVFNHFGIRVPRPSVDFTYVNRRIDVKNAKPGDIILFTGTDSTLRVVGHMGLVVSNRRDDLIFVHATSGKGYGVVETPLLTYYQHRYLQTVRVFPQNDK